MVMGHEMAGMIESVGERAEVLVAPGAPVTVNPVLSCGACDFCAVGKDNLCRARRVIGVTPGVDGAYADAIVVPRRNVVALDPAIPLEWGALVEPLSVGYHAVRQSDCHAGDPIVVIGGGTIGVACVLAATRIGAGPAMLSEPVAHRRRAATAFGALVVDPEAESLADRLSETTGRNSVRFVFDAVGTTSSLGSALSVCSPDGVIVLIGMNHPEVQLPLYDVTIPERRLIGTFCYTAEHFRETAAWVNTGPTILGGLIEARIGFPEIVERFDALASGRDHSLKAVLVTETD
jgi:2-desacetyl-2-hydroxyethyl bacteriochlorophyllide A dehydrogenase